MKIDMTRKYLILILLLIGIIAAKDVFAQAVFLGQTNASDTKRYRNVLFLGMFNSQEMADDLYSKFQTEKAVNPITLEPYDAVIAFGMGGEGLVVKMWEVTRVVMDNLSSSLTTNYAKIDGLECEYLFAHSNGNDVASNAIKSGLVKTDNFVAIAPPAGFRHEAESLYGLDSVTIFRTKKDPVAEIFGKQTVFGFLQKVFDVDVGILRESDHDEPVFGIRLRMPLSDPTIESPIIEETVFDSYPYSTEKPHGLMQNLNNIALSKMIQLITNIRTFDEKVGSEEDLRGLYEKLDMYRSKFPDAAKSIFIASYWTFRDSNEPSKSLTAARTKADMATDPSKVITAGDNSEATLMYEIMTAKFGEKNVKWVRSYFSDLELHSLHSAINVDFATGGAETAPTCERK